MEDFLVVFFVCKQGHLKVLNIVILF